MALVTDQQEVTDEQLTEWDRSASQADRVTGGCLWWPSGVTALVADLRASRAREAEWRESYEISDRLRDGLQQLIGRALALCAQMRATVDIDQDEYERLQAALTGTDPADG